MTINEQLDEIVELQPEETKAVVGGASAVEYGLVAATVSKEIIAEVRAMPAARREPSPALRMPTK